MPKPFDPFAYPEHIKLTERARALDTACKIYEGRQYDGRPDWWTGQCKGDQGGERVPLRERRPCVITRLPKRACQQVARFMFGEGKFPQITVPVTKPETDEDGERKGPRFEPIGGVALDEDKAGALQEWIAELCERAHLKPQTLSFAELGIASGTAVWVVSLLDGNYRLENPKPQHCWAQFRNDDPACEVTRLVWCYEYTATVAGEDGKPVSKTYIFRREWDAVNFYTWDDVEVKPGIEIKWGARTDTPHGLDFCPVVWTRNQATQADGLDGLSLYRGSAEKIEALDFIKSQKHRGLAYFGTPQTVESAQSFETTPDDHGGRTAGPSGYSRTSGGSFVTAGPNVGDDVYNGDGGLVQGSGGNVKAFAIHGGYGRGASSARRMAPDEVWRYEGQEVDVKVLETSGKAFEVASSYEKDKQAELLSDWGIVLNAADEAADRSRMGAEVSARYLALSYAPLLTTVNEYRNTWWPQALCALVHMCMRMCAVLNGKGILIPGSTEVAKILRPFLTVDVGGGRQEWMPPKLEPVWGDFFDKSATEISAEVDAAVKAKDGKLVTHETAVRLTADDFGIQDADKELEAIETESQEAEAKALETEDHRLEKEAKAFHDAAGGKEEKPGNPAKYKQGAAQGATDGR
jgi:hypothetical protein